MKTILMLLMLVTSNPTLHYEEMMLTPLIYFEGMETCTDALFRMPADEHLINPKWKYMEV